MRKIFILSFFAISGCYSASEVAMNNARALCNGDQSCVQRAYPQLYQTETQRRSAIDARMQQNNNSFNPMNCHSTTFNGVTNTSCF